jgi:hypothetical protein
VKSLRQSDQTSGLLELLNNVWVVCGEVAASGWIRDGNREKAHGINLVTVLNSLSSPITTIAEISTMALEAV